jgi:hypothetical protein
MKIPLPLKLMSLALFAALAFGATEFRLSDKTKVGKLVLPAGNYSLTIKDSVAKIKDEASGKTFQTEVKTQTGDVKFRETIVNAVRENGETLVRTINIGGSKDTLVFD